MTVTNPREIEHLENARAGSAEAFSALVDPYRKQLLVHCYRMSGTLEDAEDLVQETTLRAWNKLDAFRGSGAFRNWLYTIATRLWLDQARKRKPLLLPLDGPPSDTHSIPKPPTNGAWLDPLPGDWITGEDPTPEHVYQQGETISLAFMIALQKLNTPQRIVLILRDVLDWPAGEVAERLNISVAAVHNHLYRARITLQYTHPDELQAPEKSLNQFVVAWEAGDVPALIELLQQEVTFAMPPMGVWYQGQAAVQQALKNYVFIPGVRWKLSPTSANGRPAFGLYQLAGDATFYTLSGLILPLFTMQDGKISELTSFLTPQLASRFGLPPTLTA